MALKAKRRYVKLCFSRTLMVFRRQGLAILQTENSEATLPTTAPGWMGGALQRTVSFLHRMIHGLRVPPEMSERLYLDQASDFSYTIIAIAMIGLSTLLLIFLDFLGTSGAVLREVLLLATSLCYFALVSQGLLWLRLTAPTGQKAKAYIATMVRLLVLLGVIWSALLFVLMQHRNLNQLCLLYGVFVGCLATPVMVAPVSCAIAFWLPISIGISIAGFSANVLEGVVMLNLVAFMGLTGFCILYLNSRMNERAIGAIRLEESNELVGLLLRDFEESASDWLWETDSALRIQRVSPRLADVAQRPVDEIHGPFPQALLSGLPQESQKPGSAVDRLQRMIMDRSPFRDVIIPVIVSGEERYWSLTGKPVLDKQGRFVGYHGVGSDVTGPQRQQEQIIFLARHDSLTKLPNRVLFGEMLHQACESCEANNIALLCVDLDHFKVVNDTLGHATGDALLVAVSERMRGCIREFDSAARLGGDEFAVILVTGDVGEATAIAARIIERVTRPYYFDGQLVQIGVSIGISMAPADASSAAALLKNADLALYRAKMDGRGTWRLYDAAMDERLQSRRALQNALRQAIARGEMRVEYQPIVSLAQRRITGAEALARWQHPELGLLLPGDFITLAEECGLIGQIGEWVLRQACAAAAEWPDNMGVAVNLSALQFRDSGLVESITQALSASGLSARRLELEITETAMLETTPQTLEALWRLHALGVHITLDDFGTGYSSLSYLRRFPFDKIKVDRSFIHDLSLETEDSSIVIAIIGLAQRMNMGVTAEGVETAEQAELLSNYGCTQAQGYYFYQPVSAEHFAEILADNARLEASQGQIFQV